MQSGILTDTFSAARVDALAPDDWRRRGPEFKSPNLERNLVLRDALKPIAARHHTTVGAVAIAWILTWPGVTGAIVGARSADQVDGWLPAAGLTLDAEDLDASDTRHRAIGRRNRAGGETGEFVNCVNSWPRQDYRVP